MKKYEPLTARLSSTQFFLFSYRQFYFFYLWLYFSFLPFTQQLFFWLILEETRLILFKLDSIPFRFKGSCGATMAPTQTVHHHRSTTKTSHKSFKSRHASKSSLKDKAKGT